ncbi:hypothetical protein HK098_006052 [Nowakowskiella sp. JEL0407]|nr:hypothetical protein HK098_006052 [Nowakowskiella sp. JEL0407]
MPYKYHQVSGVILVTIGVILSTFSSMNTSSLAKSQITNLPEFIIGILLLTIALTLSAILGQYQQHTYAKYGKQWREGLFYTHFLALPFFAMFWKDIVRHVEVYNSSRLVRVGDYLGEMEKIVGGFGVGKEVLKVVLESRVPKMWVYLAMNILTQYVCVSGVHKLSSLATSVTLNLVLSIRKVVSLILSVIIFSNPFTVGHFLGAVLVFVGTIMYSWELF